MKIDIAQLRRLIPAYDRPGPRYTSYPTAVQFREDADPDSLLKAGLHHGGTRSVYLHLPFCETLCWFCGCFTVITKDRSRATSYLEALSGEIRNYRTRAGERQSVIQLHLGGGTPNFLETGQIDELARVIQENFHLAPDAECSVELAPNYLTEEHVKAFAALGINRGSFGVQDVDPKVQQAIHRVQPESANRDTVRWLRTNGFRSVNIDLMYGLPHQTPDSFERTLDSILSLGPDRLAVFNYAHVPWMRPAQKMLEKEGLPSPETKLEILLRLVERLDREGYEYIGMDHFARPDDELAVARRNGTLQRNFQGYSTRAGSAIAAFGLSSIGQNSEAYHQNTKDLQRYFSAVSAANWPVERGILLSEDDKIRRHLIQRLMCDLRIDTANVLTPFGTAYTALFGDWREHLARELADGLVNEGGSAAEFEVTPIGRFFLRNLAMRYDAYLAETGATRFSRTI